MKMNDMLDIFTPNPNESKGVRSVPTTQEIRDKNEQKMRIALYDRDCKIREHKVQCLDGEEFEILEIRGPKASGFFMLKIFYFFLFYVYGNEKEYHNTSPGLAGMASTPGIESATSYNLATIKTFTSCKAISQTLLSHARSRGRFPSNGADSTVHHQSTSHTRRL